MAGEDIPPGLTKSQLRVKLHRILAAHKASEDGVCSQVVASSSGPPRPLKAGAKAIYCKAIHFGGLTVVHLANSFIAASAFACVA